MSARLLTTMRLTTGISTRHHSPDAELIAVAAAGCALAFVLGAASTTRHVTVIVGGLAAFTLCVAAIVLYRRDPILAFIWMWLFTVFNSSLSAVPGYFSLTGDAIRQADEPLVVLFLCLTLWRTARGDARLPLWVILPGVGIALAGGCGAIIHGVPLKVAAVGGWLGLKLWITLAITFLLPWKQSDIARVYSVVAAVGLFVAAFGLADYLAHDSLSAALHISIYEFQAGSLRGEAAHSIFPHPNELSLFMSLLFALTFARFAATRSRSDLVLALCFAGSVLLSARLKGFLSLSAVVAIVVAAQIMASNRGAALILLVGALLLGGIYSVEGGVINQQISLYTSSEATARAKLYVTSTQIAREDFPLGAGFGRFATYPSRLYYSPVYQEYALNNVYGLSRKYPSYIDDTSWPGVIGETGYGGFAIYLVGLGFLISALVRRMGVVRTDQRWLPLAALCAVAVLLVDSLGDATLFDWLALTGFGLIVGPALVATTSALEKHQVVGHTSQWPVGSAK
jgi:hypothetical protein